jgi:Ca2+-binding EF-hand superfamily protein
LFNEPEPELTAEDAFKKLTTWMRSKNLGAEKGFHEVCSMIYGPAAPKASKLNFNQFNTALLKLGFTFDKEQCKKLFDLLDMNSDGILDQMDWKGQMPELGMTGALSKIKDIIFSKNLKADDVLKRMKYRRD